MLMVRFAIGGNALPMSTHAPICFRPVAGLTLLPLTDVEMMPSEECERDSLIDAINEGLFAHTGTKAGKHSGVILRLLTCS